MAEGERRTQTQVKHRILSAYLSAWRGIIIGGLSDIAAQRQRAGLSFRSRLVYVDGFSFKGRYEGDEGAARSAGTNDQPIWGSPIIGVQAMDAARDHASTRFGFHVETAAILVERDADNFACLLDSLRQAEIDNRRLRINPKVIEPRDGEVVVIHDDFLECYPQVVTCLSDRFTHGFALLDPYGMKGIPYEMVQQFVALPKTDVMINWPFLDLQRKQGRLDHPETRTGDHATLANVDAMFGTSIWRQLCGEVLSDELFDEISDDLELNLANLYQERLQDADPKVTVKRVPLKFSQSDRTIYYLFFTTHDANGALELNEVLDKARLWELGLRWNLSTFG